MVQHPDAKPCDSCQNALTHRSTEPSPTSPNPGYMKLPSHKLRRVRQTVYEDPGNPFGCFQKAGVSGEDRSDLWRTWHNCDPQQSESSGYHLRNVMASEAAKQSTVGRAEARRSKSIALPRSGEPMEAESDEEYVAPRTLWRRKSERRASLQGRGQNQDKRDTKFYGFYDEIMSDYRRGSRGSRFF